MVIVEEVFGLCVLVVFFFHCCSWHLGLLLTKNIGRENLRSLAHKMTTHVINRVCALQRGSKVWFKTYSWMREKETNYQRMGVIIKTML